MTKIQRRLKRTMKSAWSRASITGVVLSGLIVTTAELASAASSATRASKSAFHTAHVADDASKTKASTSNATAFNQGRAGAPVEPATPPAPSPPAATASVNLPQTTSQTGEHTPHKREQGFGFAEVREQAKALASKAYGRPPPRALRLAALFPAAPPQKIDLRPDKALWHGTKLPFQVALTRRGGLYPNLIEVSVIRDGQPRPVLFDPGPTNPHEPDDPPPEHEPQPPQIGFAGLRVLSHLNEPKRLDTVISFLGRGYFRVLGEHNVAGTLSRTPAIDADHAGQDAGNHADPEESPRFRHFWLQRPQPDNESLRLYALLDSPSLSGAYQFNVTPGDPTIVEVKTSLFFRKGVAEFGMAPLASMYLYGENDLSARGQNFRPELHDADGLLIHDGEGAFIWRPLRNPGGQRVVSTFTLNNPKGFGLLQRDRDFDHYQDFDAAYQNRTSVWIEPRGDWGRGHIKLIERPDARRGHDNIFACWDPEQTTKAGQEWRLAYRLRVGLRPVDPPESAKVVATRVVRKSNHNIRFLLDFAGPALKDVPEGGDVAAVVTADVGGKTSTIDPVRVEKNPHNHTWRVVFDAHPLGDKPVVWRAFIKISEDKTSETWSYASRPSQKQARGDNQEPRTQ